MTAGERIRTFAPLLALALVGFVVAYQFVDPAPPSKLVFSAGAPGGSYHALAEEYRKVLADKDIEVVVLDSAGSSENRQRLINGEADVAFVQSGIADSDDGLFSLGSVYYEPLWLFTRADLKLTQIRQMQGLRIAAGPEGSGTRALAIELLARNGLTGSNVTLLSLGSEAASTALMQGGADVVFMVAGVESAAVRQLVAADKVRLMPLPRAEAYVRSHAYLTRLMLPEGTLDPASNLPAEELPMLATTATLLVSSHTHPALQGLLLQTASRIHDRASLFAAAGTFPTAAHSGMPLSDEADRFYQYGPSFLQRVLPFWAATLADRLKVMLLPLVALLLPLFKVMPPLYRWRVRSRIYRWYEELTRIDHALADELDPELLAELDRIESDIRKVHVPLSYADELYNLRLHLSLIRESAEKKRG